MRRHIAFFILAITLPITGMANDNVYHFNNLFSISVSNELELRANDDAYSHFLHDTLHYSTNYDIVFQQKGLSNGSQLAFSHYCRILIISEVDNSCPYPSSDDSTFSKDDLAELLSSASLELAPGQAFAERPTYTIESTTSGHKYVDVHYSRTGTKGNVQVELCYFFNYDSIVKAIFSYRESEKDMWEHVLADARKSFVWSTPYLSQTYYAEENVQLPEKVLHIEPSFCIIVALIIIILLLITYLIKQHDDRKRREKQEIKEHLTNAQILIQQGKPLSALSQIQETSRLIEYGHPEFSQQLLAIKEQQKLLENKKSRVIEETLHSIKETFQKGPEKGFSPSVLSELFDDKEVSDEQRKHIQSNIKTLEEEYKNGIPSEQQLFHVNYTLPVCNHTSHYAFYASPLKGTIIL